MRIREATCVLACAMALLSTGCASTRAPAGWLPSAEQSAAEVRGGWIVVRYHEAAPAQREGRDADDGARGEAELLGELIAIDRDSLFVLTERAGLYGIPCSAVRGGQLASYDSQWGPLAAWGVFGTLSTISHGFVLVLSAPVWILTSTVSASSASTAPISRVRARDCIELSRFARFPQGLPPGLDRYALRSRAQRVP